MGSRLYAESPPEDFFKAVAALESAPIAAVTELATLFANNPPDERLPATRDLIPLAEKHHVSAADFRDWLRAAFLITHYCQVHDDTVEAIVTDLLEAGKITSREALEQRLAAFGEEFRSAYRAVTHTRESLTAAFPVLAHLHTRSVLSFATEPAINRVVDRPDTFKPTLARVVPAVVIQIDVDEFGETKGFSFALTQREVDEVINHLQLAKLELEAALKSYREKS